jgi:TonB family protein
MKFASLLIVLLALHVLSIAQTAEHPGIRLYKQGKTAEAATALRAAVKADAYKSDAEVWNFLGLAEMAVPDYKSARKAFEKAVDLAATNLSNSTYYTNLAYANLMLRDLGKARLFADKAIERNPQGADAYVVRGTAYLLQDKVDLAQSDADRAVSINDAYSQGYVLKSNVLMRLLGVRVEKGAAVAGEIGLLADAVGALKIAGQKCKSSECRDLIKEEMDEVEPFYNYFSRDKTVRPDPGTAVDPGVTPLKIIRKFHAGYTDSARQAGIQGSIRLAVLFGASGKVESVLLLKRLERSLDRQAIGAAMKIQFEPMKKDGVPVPVVKMMEYHFSIY